MAATMTGAGELTYASFPIDKVETDADGDLIVYGKASDGSIDSDLQIVDPTWMASAAQAWKESGANLRVQHNPQRDPAGIGLEVETDASGATWVKGLVVEPVAKKLVAKGALRAYSVGIARPTIERDATARGGRITSGELVEISLVDRPANKRCGIQLVKSADDGTPEYVNEVFGAEADIAKALGSDITKAETAEKSITPAEAAMSMDAWAPPADLDISFTPNDLMKIVQGKIIDRHYDELALKAVIEAEAGVYKRDIDTATRRRLASQGRALPNLSYPVENHGDADNAATLALSGHGDAGSAKTMLRRVAREEGWQDILDRLNGGSEKASAVAADEAKETVEKTDTPEALDVEVPEAAKEAEPEVTKDPEPEAKDKPVKKAKKKPKKLPPWLNKPSDDDDAKGDSDDDSCKMDHVHTEKCHTDPAQAAGVTASPMSPAPVGELLESPPVASTVSKGGPTPASASGAVAEHMNPVPAHREPDGATTEAFEKDAGLPSDGEAANALEAAAGMKAASADLAPDPELAALMRFKTLGVDEDLGRLHDLTCPAYSPDMAAAYHPYATLPGLIDSGAWQRKTLAAAAGPLEKALEMAELWQAVHVLKNADQAALNDHRVVLHKAFRDANPGPGSFPTPGCVSPQRYNRPVLTDGRAATATDYGSPNTAPQVATAPPNAQNFDRPPLSSGHQSPSPSFMKGGGAEYPSERGVPQRISYEQVERDKARRSLSMLHDHLNHMFPSVCTMLDQDAYRQPESRPVPAPAGIGKGNGGGGNLPSGPGDAVPAMLDNGYVVPAPVAAALKAEPEDAGMFMDADVYKSFKKMKKKLGKKVLSGKITVDEARAKLGRQFAQKGDDGLSDAQVTEDIRKGVMSIDEARKRYGGEGGSAPVPAPLSPPPAAPPVAAALDPEVIKAAVAEATTELKDLLVKQQETFTTKLAEQQRVIDAIADQPDPGTAAFSGLAFQPGVMKSRRPAAVPDQAEYAARAQAMIRRNLEHTYQTHSNPVVREKAAEALATFGVEAAP